MNYPVVKTHLLPAELAPRTASIPAAYVVRDGGTRSFRPPASTVFPTALGDDFRTTLKAAVRRREGSFFGGCRHVRLWAQAGASSSGSRS